MSKTIPLRKGFNSVLLWSVISAAFIGPGTVTTCAKSGSQFGTSLIWALTFSTFATIVLQELVARLTMATGKNLGELIAEKYQSKSTKWISILLFFAVSFGCAAYETGNIIGAIAGLKLIYPPLHSGMYAILIVAACFTILHKGTIAQVAQIMGVLVFIMGIVFFYLMWTVNLNWWQLIKDGIVPSIPPSSGTLLIGLVGTTIVPYNLFLASGMKTSQSLSEMRWGIIIAVLLGGMISIAILISGILVTGSFSYQAVFQAIKIKASLLAAYGFAIGLFAAGFSSAITAPLAAAICAKSLLGDDSVRLFKSHVPVYKITWITVLAIGAFFSLINIQPIPAIIAAQGINGLLLPIVCVALYLCIKDKQLLREGYSHSANWNWVYLIIIWVTCFLGIYNIQQALIKSLDAATRYTEFKTILIAALLSSILILFIKQDHKKSN
jgi:Mn2+/Fe2+ NRAMP family transporter